MSDITKKDPTSLRVIKPPAPFYIVGIGTSAGGLEALQDFFNNCPTNTGMAFIIVQHLSPNYKSLMPELLARNTSMKINEAHKDELVEPDHIYLIPSNKNITIKNGKLQLVDRPPNSQMNFSIDIFLHSLALDQREKSIAVILSGTGSDGTRGGEAIKEAGGTVFVQSPGSAKFDGMPRSAISGEIADYVLRPNEIPNELIDYISHPPFSDVITAADLGRNMSAMDRVLKILRGHTGFNFFPYKKPTLLRRTAKRINITKSDSLESYIDFLYTNPEEKFILVQEFLIGVTKFFRDEKAFKILQKNIIPNIVNNKKTRNEPIKIWVLACSTGEEAYSIAILFEEYLEKINSKIAYKIFATDIDERGVEKAARGFYPENIASYIDPKRLDNFFIKKDNGYQISPKIRKNIIFSKHDVLENPPFSKMDLVSCRNMLIYMEKQTQLKVLSNLHYSLRKEGYLFLGSAENIDVVQDRFSCIDHKWKIYQNISTARIISTTLSQPWIVEGRSNTINNNKPTASQKEKIDNKVSKVLSDMYNSASVCVNEYFEIVYAIGKLKKYAEMPEQGFSTNILEILPDEINIPISTGVRKMAKEGKEQIEKIITYVKGENTFSIKLIISLLDRKRNKSNNLFLITLLELSNRPLTNLEQKQLIPANKNHIEEIKGLREAVSYTHLTLPTICSV